MSNYDPIMQSPVKYLDHSFNVEAVKCLKWLKAAHVREASAFVQFCGGNIIMSVGA